jgi:hypothetical protein
VVESIEGAIADIQGNAADIASVSTDTASNTAALAAASVSLTSLDARIDAYDALAPFVRQDQTAAWVDPTGTLARTTFAAVSSFTVSNPPTQAEVQAIADHVVILSQRLAALVTDLRGNNVLT